VVALHGQKYELFGSLKHTKPFGTGLCPNLQRSSFIAGFQSMKGDRRSGEKKGREVWKRRGSGEVEGDGREL